MTPTEIRYLMRMAYGLLATFGVVTAAPAEYTTPAAWTSAALWAVLVAAYGVWLVSNRRRRRAEAGAR